MRRPIAVLGAPGSGVGRILAAGILFLAIAGQPPRSALGNGAEIGFDAGGVFPLESTDVQLESEFVTVYFGGFRTTRVECQYTLKNLTGLDQKVSMAFAPGETRGGDSSGFLEFFQQSGFSVERAGRQRTAIPVRLAKVDGSRWVDVLPSPPDSLPVWDISFKPHQKVIFTITYDAAPSGGCEGTHCGFRMKYHARPARLWAGTIEDARIEFEFDQLAGVLMSCNPDFAKCLELTASPEGYRRSPSGFVWELKDWEPEQDFEVAADWTGNAE